MKKKSHELKQGDVFWIKQDMLMYLRALGPDLAISGVHCYVLNAALSNPLTTRYLYDNEMYELEPDQDLTPAQQHADELLELAHVVASFHNSKSSHSTSATARAKELVEKLAPKPPTLDEALALIRYLAGGYSVAGKQSAEELLDRARRSGVYK